MSFDWSTPEEYSTIFGDKDVQKISIDSSHLKILKKFKATTDFENDLSTSKEKKRKASLTEDFHLSIYLPKVPFLQGNKKINRCIIMVNGLNEIRDIDFTLYDQLGANFAKRGIASILLPTPHHLNRYNRKKRSTTPLEYLFKRPSNILHNTKQSFIELLDLRSAIKGTGKSKDYNEFFSSIFCGEDTKVSLLGYSLGGLRVLSRFMESSELFDGCILISSGFRLNELNLKDLTVKRKYYLELTGQSTRGESKDDLNSDISVTPDVWREFNKKLNAEIKASQEIRNSDFYLEIFLPIFQGFFWDEDEWEKKVEKLFPKLLLIVGGNDTVSPPTPKSDSKNFLKGATIFQIPGLSHFLPKDPVWQNWEHIVTDLISNFIENIESSLTTKKDIIKDLKALDKKYDLFSDAISIENSNLSKIAEKIEASNSNYLNKDRIDFYTLTTNALCYFKNLEELVKRVK